MARSLRPTGSAWVVAIVVATVSLVGAPAAFAASVEPAPTPGCVFTGGAFTCGGAVPPDVAPAPPAPAPDAPTEPEPSDPDPSDPGSSDPDVSDPDPSGTAPATPTEPDPTPGPTDSPGVPADDGSATQVVPLWIPLTIGGAAIAAVIAGAAYAVRRRRGDEPRD